MSTYTERDVEEFFDQTAATYLSFWDSEGVLHTGYFAGEDDTDYQAAAARTSAVLAEAAGIDKASHVLDVGRGCGNFVLYLARQFGCRCEGIDLSSERISVARDKLTAGDAVVFRHGSATALPYPDGTFSHVVSQDALFLVPDKPRSHAEMFRVLAPGGILALTDFLQPKPQVSADARTHVYDRVRWSSGYSLDGYAAALRHAGFEIVLERGLDPHIKQTYRVLAAVAASRASQTADPVARAWIEAFARSCGHIEAAVDRGEFGWGILVARKPV